MVYQVAVALTDALPRPVRVIDLVAGLSAATKASRRSCYRAVHDGVADGQMAVHGQNRIYLRPVPPAGMVPGGLASSFTAPLALARSGMRPSRGEPRR
jgi:hypothetical protein